MGVAAVEAGSSDAPCSAGITSSAASSSRPCSAAWRCSTKSSASSSASSRPSRHCHVRLVASAGERGDGCSTPSGGESTERERTPREPRSGDSCASSAASVHASSAKRVCAMRCGDGVVASRSISCATSTCLRPRRVVKRNAAVRPRPRQVLGR
eukprot:1003504-Pleurochrysis_carterae.AAC.1